MPALLFGRPLLRVGACLIVGIAAMAAAIDLAPTVEDIDGTEVVFQKPPANVTGVLVVAHGCSRSALDWFPRSKDCEDCLGYPEEVRVTRAALARGYALVALSSTDRRGRRCWDVDTPRLLAESRRPSRDLRAAPHVLAELLLREGLDALPIYALGASSGGAFVLALAHHMRLDGVCCQIMALPPALLERGGAVLRRAAAAAAAADDAASPTAPKRMPPTMFVHMPRDKETAEGVAQDVRALARMRVPTRVIEVEPRPVTPDLLLRVPELAGNATGGKAAAAAAEAVLKALGGAQLVKPDTGELLKNPREADWRSVLQGVLDDEDALRGLGEVLNLAWAGHEIVSDTTDEMLDWFEAQTAAAAAAAAKQEGAEAGGDGGGGGRRAMGSDGERRRRRKGPGKRRQGKRPGKRRKGARRRRSRREASDDADPY